MRRGWEDVAARVRGLATHVLTRATIAQLGHARDCRSSPRNLGACVRRPRTETRGPSGWSSARGVTPPAPFGWWRDGAATGSVCSNRSTSTRTGEVFARCCGEQPPEGAPSERLAGVVPTPALPERALEELARQPSTTRIVALLAAWGHPFGHALLPEGRASRPDLLRLEQAMNRAYAARALKAARRAPRPDGARRDLLGFVRRTIDWKTRGRRCSSPRSRTARIPARSSLTAASSFRGRHLWPQRRRRTWYRRRRCSTALFAGTSLAGAFGPARQRAWEDAALTAQLRDALVAARREPLGVAPLDCPRAANPRRAP